jgi:hypothetical protein
VQKKVCGDDDGGGEETPDQLELTFFFEIVTRCTDSQRKRMLSGSCIAEVSANLKNKLDEKMGQCRFPESCFPE